MPVGALRAGDMHVCSCSLGAVQHPALPAATGPAASSQYHIKCALSPGAVSVRGNCVIL